MLQAAAVLPLHGQQVLTKPTTTAHNRAAAILGSLQ